MTAWRERRNEYEDNLVEQAMPEPERAEPAKPAEWVTDDARRELLATTPPTWQDAGGAGDATATPAPTWQRELPRWLATLNPGRTPREYEKAISYFFLTPGVPAALDQITFDLLLAYRGALALRAAPRERGAAYGPASPRRDSRAPALDTPQPSNALPTGGSAGETGADAEEVAADAPTPLAPATVNIRLTALRQFLVHCALMGLLPHLSPERIRAALRRLPIEHRRPYQILAEAEWEEFLRAALLPAENAAQHATQPPSDATSHAPGDDQTERTQHRGGPWGTPRVARLERAEAQHAAGSGIAPDAAPAERATEHAQAPGVKSRFGLTGARTAQRDHALVALALATGLRAIEISQLDIADLQREWHAGREEWWLVLPDAKTKGQKGGRTLPLAPQLVETLMAYIRSTGRKWENPADQAAPLFLSVYERRARGRGGERSAPRAARRLLPGQIARIVDRVEAQWLALREERAAHGDAMSAGETRAISTHALRHSTAVALLEGNAETGRPPASVEHVRGWLGHFDIRTTQGYLAHLDARRHRRPFTLSPVSGVSGAAPAAAPPAPPAREDGETDDA
jgi:integrase